MISSNTFATGSGGMMTIGIGGTVPGSSLGLIQFTAAAPLAGTTNTVLINNFIPANGQVFSSLKYASKSGAFTTSNLNAGNNVSFTTVFGATSLALTTHVVIGSSVAFHGGPTLSITGTAAAETISLGGRLDVLTAAVGSKTSVFSAIPILAFSVDAGAGNDVITNNTSVAMTCDAGPGNDKITGGPGNDIITGGDGNDTAIGNGGNATYVFRTSAMPQTDFIAEAAGAGTDTIDCSAVTGNIVANLSSDTLATMLNRTIKTLTAGTFNNIENFFGGGGNDVITGNSAANLLKGNTGNDKFFVAGGGKDSCDGGLGTDSVGSADATDVLISIP